MVSWLHARQMAKEAFAAACWVIIPALGLFSFLLLLLLLLPVLLLHLLLLKRCLTWFFFFFFSLSLLLSLSAFVLVARNGVFFFLLSFLLVSRLLIRTAREERGVESPLLSYIVCFHFYFLITMSLRPSSWVLVALLGCKISGHV